MTYLEIIMLSIALAMDASTVSISNGITMKKFSIKYTLIIAFAFGIFQAIMPLIGYFAGFAFSGFISAIDHWVALILLGGIGIKMIYSAFSTKSKEKLDSDTNNFQRLSIKLIIIQAFATSIDAFAVGVTFVSTEINIFLTVAIIGLITLVISFISVFIGKKFGDILGNKAELIGGLILIVIGMKLFLS